MAELEAKIKALEDEVKEAKAELQAAPRKEKKELRKTYNLLLKRLDRLEEKQKGSFPLFLTIPSLYFNPTFHTPLLPPHLIPCLTLF
jgi:septal ring factor EnvC (AmiA/AmiB activator)